MGDDSNTGSGGGGLFERLTTLVRAGRAFRKGNTGRAGLLIGSVLVGRRRSRLGYLLQLADTVNQVRKRLR
jgi:hypothetical protein